jgi:hypothetical protein
MVRQASDSSINFSKTSSIREGAELVGVSIYQSSLYRWLKTDPEPAVYVIRVEDALSAAPVIVAINRALRWVLPTATSATVVDAGEFALDRFRQRPIQIFSLFIVVLISTMITITTINGSLGILSLVVTLICAVFALTGLYSEATLEDLRGHPVTRAVVTAVEPSEPSHFGKN